MHDLRHQAIVADNHSLLSIRLDSPIYDLVARESMLFVMTIDCQARVYNTQTRRALFQPCSVAHLIASGITKLDIRPNGTPIIFTSEPAAFAFDRELQDWTCVCSPWYLSNSSDASRNRPSGSLSQIEQICRLSLQATSEAKANEKLQWWTEALEMGCLDCRIRASALLDSGQEYRHWVMEYTSYIGREGFVDRADELVQELLGPIFG